MRVEAETIQAINPNNVEGLLAAGYGLILVGDAEYGLSLLKEALRSQDQQPCRFSRAAIGDYYSRKGEWTESLEYYRKAYTDN
jgi:tetratricopeptide (TPR) repeat protein